VKGIGMGNARLPDLFPRVRTGKFVPTPRETNSASHDRSRILGSFAVGFTGQAGGIMRSVASDKRDE
jgi:hypothetical protein